jgi:hypothetical protein
MEPGSDGRTYACPYCDAEQQVAIAAEQVAAGLRADLANVSAFIVELARTLQHNFADRTRLHQHDGRIVGFEIDLDKDRFVAKHESDGVVAMHKKMVRGVALKTVTHPIDVWIDLLARALAAHANTRAHAARVLAQIKVT